MPGSTHTRRRFVGNGTRANFASFEDPLPRSVRVLHCVRRGATTRARRPPASLIMGVPKTKVRALACFARLSRPRIVPDAPAFPPRLPRFPIADTPNSVDPTNAVVPGGGGGAPQGREEVRRRQVALHPKGSGARQDPEPAIQRGPQGEPARHRRDPSLSHRRQPPARSRGGALSPRHRAPAGLLAATPTEPRLLPHRRTSGETCIPATAPRIPAPTR